MYVAERILQKHRAGERGPSRSAAPAQRGLGREELDRWLSEPGVLQPTVDEVAAAFGVADVSFAPLRSTRERLCFILAVLRDAFGSDRDVSAWLLTPGRGRDDERPIDLLREDRLELLESLAVAEWNHLMLQDPLPRDHRAGTAILQAAGERSRPNYLPQRRCD